MLVRCLRTACQGSQRNTLLPQPRRWNVAAPSGGNAPVPLLAYALDGQGGAARLDPWKEHVMTRTLAQQRLTKSQVEAPGGIWIHSDFKIPRANFWLRRVGGKRIAAQTSSWLREDQAPNWLAETQPSFMLAPTSDALILTLRVAQCLPTESEKNPKFAALRMWFMKHLLITSWEGIPGESDPIVQEIVHRLRLGEGETTCSRLAAAIVELSTALSMAAVQDVEATSLSMKGRLQGLSGGSLSQELLEELRSDHKHASSHAKKVHSYLLPQQETMHSMMNFCQRGDQNIFSVEAAGRYKQSFDQHQALMESLDATRSGNEALEARISELFSQALSSNEVPIPSPSLRAPHPTTTQGFPSSPITIPVSSPIQATPMTVPLPTPSPMAVQMRGNSSPTKPALEPTPVKAPEAITIGRLSGAGKEQPQQEISGLITIGAFQVVCSLSLYFLSSVSKQPGDGRPTVASKSNHDVPKMALCPEEELSLPAQSHLDKVMERLPLLLDVDQKLTVVNKLLRTYQDPTSTLVAGFTGMDAEICKAKLTAYRDGTLSH